jgi:uncharacterized membrane protein
MPPRPSLGLEQRIGARWATWVGIVVILVAAALFLKWAFDNEYLGPGARVGVGVVGGLLMLLGGLLLRRRQDVPYLSEGLAGGGLGCLYLSLFAAHVLYGLIGPAAAFTSMFAVTLLGTLVAVLSGRLSTAVLAVLGGLLTPVLLRVERPDERNLLAYLLLPSSPGAAARCSCCRPSGAQPRPRTRWLGCCFSRRSSSSSWPRRCSGSGRRGTGASRST